MKSRPAAGHRGRCSGFIGRLLTDRRANVALVVAVALLPVLAVVGLATDSTIGYLARNRLGRSLDAAGLAAARVLIEADVQADATEFFLANFPDDYLQSEVDEFTVVFDQDTGIVTVTASASVPTYFMRIFGQDTLQISARTVIERTNRGAEIALVLDNTGSMRSGGKMDAMKDAATELINIIFGAETELDDLWVSLVPYTATVNIDPANTAFLDILDQVFDAPSPFSPTVWKGCVLARGAGLDETDDPYDVIPFASYLYEAEVDNDWTPVDDTNMAQNSGTGPNLGCGPAITPLTNQRDDLIAGIAEMLPWHRGGTAGNLGMVWGWRTISPRWRALWGGPTPADMPLDYDDPRMEKVVVMLTDGQNQFYDWPSHPGNPGPSGSDYTAYGRLNDFGFATLSQGRAELDSRMTRLCDNMKDEGVIIYTITFGSTPNAATQALYGACASDPANYYHAPDNAALSIAFNSIGQRLSNLRIVE